VGEGLGEGGKERGGEREEEQREGDGNNPKKQLTSKAV